MPINDINEKPQLAQTQQPKQTTTTYDYGQNKKDQNNAIVRSQLEVSLKMGNEPMALLYKTALSAINEALDPTQESQPIQKAYEQKIDVSPEATATRIVNFATGFYQAFQQQNSDLSAEESLDTFMSTIKSGIEIGFNDARDILESLSVLEGKVETDIDSTYDLVQDKLNFFVDNFFNEKESTESDESL